MCYLTLKKFWLIGSCLIILFIVMLGGYTRLRGAGLSIVEWKPVTGMLPPISKSDWNTEFAKYQNSPEYKTINSNFTLNEFKHIFIIEYTHRMLGRSLLIYFSGFFLFFLCCRKLSNLEIRFSITVMILIFIQGIFGWYMVKSGLIHKPHVSHYRLALHLFSAICIFSVIFWRLLSLFSSSTKNKTSNRYKMYCNVNNSILMYIIIFLFTLQVLYGAFTAGLKAGYIYESYIFMGTKFLPVFPEIKGSFNVAMLINDPSLVQFLHRSIAIILLFTTILLFIMELSVISLLLMVSIAIQFIIGTITLIYNIPVITGIIHQSWIFIIIMILLSIIMASYKNDLNEDSIVERKFN